MKMPALWHCSKEEAVWIENFINRLHDDPQTIPEPPVGKEAPSYVTEPLDSPHLLARAHMQWCFQFLRFANKEAREFALSYHNLGLYPNILFADRMDEQWAVKLTPIDEEDLVILSFELSSPKMRFPIEVTYSQLFNAFEAFCALLFLPGFGGLDVQYIHECLWESKGTLHYTLHRANDQEGLERGAEVVIQDVMASATTSVCMLFILNDEWSFDVLETYTAKVDKALGPGKQIGFYGLRKGATISMPARGLRAIIFSIQGLKPGMVQMRLR